ncbi:hypothetical protein [Bacillus cereus]|uniref:hypothetical protein n=1 Tax=Bacillus cereus TaxID=1396 RepID=UPI00032F5FF0|nr:hypothetical protein [Bacillus cereus]EOO11489.1 hypothetical protein IG9_05911 [Bacillus cereus HuA2-9]
MTQNQIIKKWMNAPADVTRKHYLDSKRCLSACDRTQKFYDIQGFNRELFLATKEWFDASIIPNQKRGLNIQGYMRLIAM